MSIFFEVEIKVTARVLVEMNDGETAEQAQQVAIEEGSFLGDITAENAKKVSGIELENCKRHCDETISL